MTRSLLCAWWHNYHFVCWLRECGLLGDQCDLALPPDDEARLERIIETGYFERIVPFWGRDASGMNIFDRHDQIRAVLEGGGRPYRRKADYMDLLAPNRFYSPDMADWDEYVVYNSAFVSFGALTDHMRWVGADLSCWEHGLIYCKGSKIRMYSTPYYDGSHSLWLGLHGIGHPADALGSLYATRSELVADGVRRRMRILPVPVVDRQNHDYREKVNYIYDYNPALGEKVANYKAVFFSNTGSVMHWHQDTVREFLEKAAGVLGKNGLVVKPHPGARWEKPVSYGSVEVLEQSILPWEMFLVNTGGWDDRLLISAYHTNALFTPKVCFDDEPYVLILTHLLPENARNYRVNLDLDLSRDVRGLYRKPEKFMIPENWDEAWDFVRRFAKTHL